MCELEGGEIFVCTLVFEPQGFCRNPKCDRYLECSPVLELGCKRTLPPRNNSEPEVWHKNNKALIKAGNLKGLLGYPTCKPVECISAILKIEDKEDLLNQFSRPTTKDEEQFGRIEERPQLEDRFRGLLTVSWTRGYSPRRLPISWIGLRTPMAVYSRASSDS